MGKFKDGKYHGKGKIVRSDATVVAGKFKNGEIVEQDEVRSVLESHEGTPTEN